MTGQVFRDRLRDDHRLASVPVIALIGEDEVAERPGTPGGSVYLRKPISSDQLTEAIRRFAGPRVPVVLVVEDEPAVRSMLDVILPKYGFAVRSAASGEAAVEVYREFHADIDVVLLDVQMPGWDGPFTLAALQGVDAHVRVCFMSGNTGRYSAEELKGMGAGDVLAKPFASLDGLALALWGMVAERIF